MSIISKVGRKSPKVRLLNASIHLVLLLGAITMIYPFLLMISSSVKSAVDSTQMALIPKYLYDDAALYKKYLEARYNEESNRLADNYAGKYMSFAEVSMPPKANEALIKDWNEYIKGAHDDYSVYHYYVSEQYGRGVYPLNQRKLRAMLRKESGNDLRTFNQKYNTGVQSWEQIVIEEYGILARTFVSGEHGYLGRYRSFKKSIAPNHRDYINVDGAFVRMVLIPEFGDIRALNQALGTTFADWSAISLPLEIPSEDSPLKALRPYWQHYVKHILSIRFIGIKAEAAPRYRQMLMSRSGTVDKDIEIPQVLPDTGREVDDYTYFIENLAKPEDLYVRSMQAGFRDWLQEQYPDVKALNNAWQQQFADFREVSLSSAIPASSIYEADDWLEFVRTKALDALEIRPSAQSEFLDYLKAQYAMADGSLDIQRINRDWGRAYDAASNIYPHYQRPVNLSERAVWDAFVQTTVAPVHIYIVDTSSIQNAYRDFLRQKYGNIESLNSAWHLGFESFESLAYPMQQIDYASFLPHRAAIRKEFLLRNYIMVLDQMLNDARSLRNTLIYCLLSILFAITVNPLAAYALSRFKPRFTYQIIMFFMLTMAFPAMVMGIPNFLMLKKLNLLNTFWALVLPAAADGYFIFLLKGFFDSQPKELYESARLDGAGEFRLFWQFTISLSKPILAVIALGAFNAAYRNFLFAFIVCQDQSMWTIMVHIYELMQRASSSVGYAALVIAAIPTLLVFIFFQNMIIKGIVVPMEK